VAEIPDLVAAVKTRRKNLKKKWTGKKWKEARLGFIRNRGGKCEWCGSDKNLTVHHPMRNSYGDDTYMDFYLSGCILLCSKCHTAVHVGRVLCDRVHEDGENHYKWHDAEMCSYCFLKENPEILEKSKENKRIKRKIQRELRNKEKLRVQTWKLNHPKVNV
jgi:hypothetical protein